ncbi:MAG: hypothetical protein EBW37_14320, partial [Rhodobacteraceae bacterium]|nr:hypothetical protein [Paracoccaceae bacterium]
TSVGIILADWMQNWKSHVQGDMAFEQSCIGNPHLMNRPLLAQSRFQLSRLMEFTDRLAFCGWKSI